MTFTWVKHPLTQERARELRVLNRRRPGIELDDHKFNYADLKELWSAGECVVLTHDKDPVWQFWYVPLKGNAKLVSYHGSREVAQTAAQEYEPQPVGPLPGGRYIVALSPSGNTLRIKCLSKDPSVTRGIFESLGYETHVETIK